MPVDETEKYYRVRQRQPSQFKSYRTPAWAALVAGKTSKGSKIVMGKTAKGQWKIQSIIIRKRKGIGKVKAVALAKKIRCKIERMC